MTPITLIQLIRDIFYTLNLAIVWQTAGERRPALDIFRSHNFAGFFPHSCIPDLLPYYELKHNPRSPGRGPLVIPKLNFRLKVKQP